jgi:hypothetical protein
VARVVAVHGIGQQYGGARLLAERWVPALREGLERADHPDPDAVDVRCAFYGDVFRPPGKTAGPMAPPLTAADVAPGIEIDLLLAWWEAAAAAEPDLVPGPDQPTKAARTPAVVQRALLALAQSRFWSGLAERALVADLRQVRLYLEDRSVRAEIRRRVAAAIDPGTRVVVAHSLGAVVAYEVLCARSEPTIDTFVTLGAPLGIPYLIHARLEPPPVGGLGCWPRSVGQWINVADQGDSVALVKALDPVFQGTVEDHLVHNGATAHEVRPYLSAKTTGLAILTGLDV